MVRPHGEEAAVLARLSALDRFLPLWIALAMLAGLGIGRWFPGVQTALESVRLGSTSLPIALGLLLPAIGYVAGIGPGTRGKVGL